MVNSISARLRVSCTLAFVITGCAFESRNDSDREAVGHTAEALSADATVYTDTSPASPWQNWSWSTTVALANTDWPLASGSSSQIKATVNGAWGALSLAHASGDLNVADYDAISFDVRGAWSTSLLVAVNTLSGAGGDVQATIPVTTTWTRQTVKLSAVQGSLSQFGKIDLIGPRGGETFYVDNVTLVPKVATTSSTYPSSPLTVTKGSVVTMYSSAGPYSLYVPATYDATHHTPTKLLVWLHGCGGNAYGDAWATSPGGNQSWITVSVGGRDGTCWNADTDTGFPLAALDDVRHRLNIDPHRVVIGGYSSGGDMAYRTAFYNASRFAGIIAENTAPFRDTGSSATSSMTASAWKLPVAHLAHVSDTTYPIDLVRNETDQLRYDGFPMTRIERAGTHWDPDTSSSGTNYDMRTYLLPYLDAGWTSP